MLGVTHQDGSFVNGGSSFRRDGSLMSGSMRGSNFQRGILILIDNYDLTYFDDLANILLEIFSFIYPTQEDLFGGRIDQ